MTRLRLDTTAKALTVNLEPSIYGSFAEIGAGQEVARQFFRVGGAAGTIAKTMSAYDMKFSDDIYGKASRYVARDRLLSMLDHEYDLLITRLGEMKGSKVRFFTFADTVSARNFKGNNECHGWVGIRYQPAPQAEPNDIIMHVRMRDDSNLLQQQAVGVFGVNVVYGAFFLGQEPVEFIRSLSDELGQSRIEVDMIEFLGPGYKSLDNRLMSLKLVENKLTNAIMFDSSRKVRQPSEILYKHPVLVERGSFKPIVNANKEMILGAKEQFERTLDPDSRKVVMLLETSLNNLLATGLAEGREFLNLADTLCAEGFNVLISDYALHFDLVDYFRRYTQEPIGFAMGVNGLIHVFNDSYYRDLPGGIMEAFGKLFGRNVKAFVYPMSREALEVFLLTADLGEGAIQLAEGDLITADRIGIIGKNEYLYKHLLRNEMLVPIEKYSFQNTHVLSTDIAVMLRKGDPEWESYVPEKAAEIIKKRRLYGLPEKYGKDEQV